MSFIRRLRHRLFSLPGRVVLFNLVPAIFILSALIIIFISVRSLVENFEISEQARLNMESARESAQLVQNNRALLMELYATSIQGDLEQLLLTRYHYDETLKQLQNILVLSDIKVDTSFLKPLSDQVLNAGEALLRRDVPASTAMMNEIEKKVLNLMTQLDDIAERQKIEAKLSREKAINSLQTISWIVAYLLIAATLAILLLTLGIERLIRKPLELVLDSLNSIVNGNNWQPLTATGNDEINRIYIALNALHRREEERCEHIRQLEFLANYDPLTSLPNRILLTQKLQQEIVNAQSFNTHVAVVVIDLDDFKQVNDRYGHEFGDLVLTLLSKRMQASLRDKDIISRLGGDEFVVVFSGIKCHQEAELRMNELLLVIGESIEYRNRLITLHASAGISIYPQNEEVDPDQLIRQADSAMYLAKQSGRNSLAFFDVNNELLLRQQHDMVIQLKNAIKLNQLTLFYQPQVHLLTGKIVGVEALIRWHHPDKGLLTPYYFLPSIQQHLLAIELGEWIIRRAIDDCHQWNLSGIDIPVAINLFPLQLQDDRFLHRLKNCLKDSPAFNSNMLELEIVETAALDDIDKAAKAINSCKDLGIYFALDDFGTGYSSLTYLKRLPVKKVKLDQSFVRGMLEDSEDAVIVQGVLNMAKAFGLNVIAEGVETFEHGEKLIELGCYLAQGYAIAKPMSKEELFNWTLTWKLPEQWKLK